MVYSGTFEDRCKVMRRLELENNGKVIEVLDSIMGSGKTTGIINWMVNNPQNKYMYVSPLLTEVEERIPSSCEILEFVSPNTNLHETKSAHLLQLLKKGKNVSFSHSLFTSLTKDHLYYIEKEGYVLVVDEEIDFISQYSGNDYNRQDMITLEQSGHIKINENDLGRVDWIWGEDQFAEGSSYAKMKRMCELQMLHCAKRDRGMIVTHLPLRLIVAAKRCVVMTYMFRGSVMDSFMRMKGVTVKDFTEVQLIKTEAQVKYEAAEKITLAETPSIRKIKHSPKKYRLSSSWYKESATREELKNVSNAILSACRKHSREDVVYTLPKGLLESKDRKIRIRGYNMEECYLFCGIKATNLYSHKTVMVHAFSRHPIQTLSAYLQDYGFPVDPDEFAISELVQWVWRSNIREGGKITLYIISKRMERLFKMWLDGEL